MGGIFLGQTNRRDMPGEFNWWIDAHAARAVMRSGAPVRLVGLDVTLKVRLRREHAAAMAAGGRPFGEFAGECTIAWLDRLARAHPGDPEAGRSCAMHDPLAVAALSRPGLLTLASVHVDVVTGDGIGRGVAIAGAAPHNDRGCRETGRPQLRRVPSGSHDGRPRPGTRRRACGTPGSFQRKNQRLADRDWLVAGYRTGGRTSGAWARQSSWCPGRKLRVAAWTRRRPRAGQRGRDNLPSAGCAAHLRRCDHA
jgi:inosine-uridine preferring nucleoside hydrolase